MPQFPMKPRRHAPAFGTSLYTAASTPQEQELSAHVGAMQDAVEAAEKEMGRIEAPSLTGSGVRSAAEESLRAARASIDAALQSQSSCTALLSSTTSAALRQSFDGNSRRLGRLAQRSEELAAEDGVRKVTAQMLEANEVAGRELSKANSIASEIEAWAAWGKAAGRTTEEHEQARTTLAALIARGTEATKLAQHKLDFSGRDGSAMLPRAGAGIQAEHKAAARKLDELREWSRGVETQLAGAAHVRAHASRVVDEQKGAERAKFVAQVATSVDTLASKMKAGYAEAASLASKAQEAAEKARGAQIQKATETMGVKRDAAVASVVQAETTKSAALAEGVARARDGVEAEYTALVGALDEAKYAVGRAEQACAELTGERNETVAAQALIEARSHVQSAESTVQRSAKARASVAAAASTATTSLRALERIAAQRRREPRREGDYGSDGRNRGGRGRGRDRGGNRTPRDPNFQHADPRDEVGPSDGGGDSSRGEYRGEGRPDGGGRRGRRGGRGRSRGDEGGGGGRADRGPRPEGQQGGGAI